MPSPLDRRLFLSLAAGVRLRPCPPGTRLQLRPRRRSAQRAGLRGADALPVGPHIWVRWHNEALLGYAPTRRRNILTSIPPPVRSPACR